MNPVVIDFETDAIEGRPDYPPRPVGVAVMWPGAEPRYFAWDHPVENNCEQSEATYMLHEAFRHPGGILMQNARFDLDVADVHMGVKPPSWQQVHDTQLLLFLDDPHSKSYSLKPAAERYLGMPPEEQDAVAEWLMANYRPDGKKLTRKQTGAYISKAPASIVGPYAIGDVVRTQKLFDLLYPRIDSVGMLEPYNRERKLLPVLLDMERTGIRVDVPRLRKDVPTYQNAVNTCDKWVGEMLGREVNVDSNEDLIEALDHAGYIDRTTLPKTKTGKDSADKDALAAAINDPAMLMLLQYRGAMATCVRTFLAPWLETARRSGGVVFTQWYSTRKDDGGARTGRLSSSPNMQNIPKAFKAVIPPAGLPSVPLARSYMLPDKGHIWCKRDFSSQEYRILAHYEDGALAQSYIDNPRADYHTVTKERVHQLTGLDISRQQAKTVNFALCIAEGQLVLTDAGLIPIEKITSCFRVWDGVEWVRHGGVVCNGTQEVMTYGGLTATPGHQVLTPEGRYISLREAATQQIGLVRGAASGATGRPARVQDPWRRLSLAGAPAGEGYVQQMSEDNVVVRGQYPGGKDPGMSMFESAQIRWRPACHQFKQAVRRYVATLQQTIVSMLLELWWSWNTVPVYAGGVHCLYTEGASARIVPQAGYRPDRQRRALRAGESSVSDAQRKPWAHASQQARVYDILDAGPRSRFTVSGVIVHNCYGAGVKKLAGSLGVDEATAVTIRNAVNIANPDVVDLDRRLKYLFRQGQAIRTWGGRLYHVEPPEMGEHDDGTTYVKRSFEYKALNYLIQGSSADVTKEALLMYDARRVHGRVLCTVHDEINISVPKRYVDSEMKILRECMSNFPTIDVPMLSEGSFGPSWGALKSYED